jgi:hypothetical protein
MPLNTGLYWRQYRTLGRRQIISSVKRIVDNSEIYGDVIKRRNYCHKVNIYVRHTNAFVLYLWTVDTKIWRLKLSKMSSAYHSVRLLTKSPYINEYA